MSAKPSTTPRWAETAGGVSSSNVLVPSSGEQDVGWTNGQTVVASNKMNWLFKTIYDWILYLRDAVFVATASSGLPGVDATGDGAAPGGKFTPGGGAAPARGAVNLPPQNAPTAPADGDLWATATALFARIAGATLQLLDTTTAALARLSFIGNPGNAASTAYAAWAGDSQGAVATNPLVGGIGQTRVLVGDAAHIRSLTLVTGQLTAGGPVTVSINRLTAGGATTGAGVSITIPAGTPAGTRFTVAANAVILNSDYLEVQIQNGAGVTASIGLCGIAVQLSAA